MDIKPFEIVSYRDKKPVDTGYVTGARVSTAPGVEGFSSRRVEFGNKSGANLVA
jgi:hypothetical protein